MAMMLVSFQINKLAFAPRPHKRKSSFLSFGTLPSRLSINNFHCLKCLRNSKKLKIYKMAFQEPEIVLLAFSPNVRFLAVYRNLDELLG
jgi:hypothetical protein